MRISLCTTVVRNTAQNSSDNFPSYPPDNHHGSDDVYWTGTGASNTDQVHMKLLPLLPLVIITRSVGTTASLPESCDGRPTSTDCQVEGSCQNDSKSASCFLCNEEEICSWGKSERSEWYLSLMLASILSSCVFIKPKQSTRSSN